MIKFILNIIGKFLGYGCCPNCKDSYWLKGYVGFFYNTSNGILLCSYCYRNPLKINPVIIAIHLKKCGWELEKVIFLFDNLNLYIKKVIFKE